MRSVKWFVLTSLLLSACATIPNTTGCTVAGRLDAGMICAETLSPKTSEKNFAETLEFLEPTDTHAGAYCMSMEDRLKEKTFVDQICRELGKRCRAEETGQTTMNMPLVIP